MNLVPAVPFELVLQNSLGESLHASSQAGLGPSEHREVELELPRELRRLHLRVVGPDGEPVPLASIHVTPLVEGGTSSSHRTDEAGRLEIDRIRARRVSIGVMARGHAPLRLEDVAVPVDGSALTLELARGLALAVLVEDPSGRRVSGARVRGTYQSDDGEFSVSWGAPEGEPGRYELENLTDAPLELELRFAGQEHTQTHHPGWGDARFEVPAHGSLRVRWSDVPMPDDPDSVGRIVLRPTETGLPEQRIRVRLGDPDASPAGRGEGTVLVPHVLPGPYAVSLELDSRAGDPQQSPAAGPVSVEVRADEAAEVALGE
jgi:hypothetical protein